MSPKAVEHPGRHNARMPLSFAELLLLALLAVNLVLLLWLAFRRSSGDAFTAEIGQALAQQARGAERLERELRAEVQGSAQGTRGELAQGLSLFQQALLAQSGEVARTQNEQIDSFRTQLATMQQQVAQTLLSNTEALTRQLQALAEGNERRLGEVRQAVELKLAALQEGNEKKLDQMRATVDEKLHATLEQRLGESFKQVAERLEQVQDRKSTRLNSSHNSESRMPSSA
jgi:DNA recombination protein RmuC